MVEILAFVVLLLFLLYAPYVRRTTDKGAPYVPMEPYVVNNVMNLLEIKPGEVFYDLGSGDGRLVMAAASRRAKAFGIEIDPLRVFLSRFMIFLWRLSNNAKIIKGDFFNTSLSGANIVSLFLLQSTNQKLKDKLIRELKPGTKVISYAFTLEGWKPTKTDQNVGSVYGPIYLYIL